MPTYSSLTHQKVLQIIDSENLKSTESILRFLETNKNRFSFYDLSKIAEHANQERLFTSAYYTDLELLNEVKNQLPDFDANKSIYILEPSVGVGNFLPILFEKYKNLNCKIFLDVVDIDDNSLKILKRLLSIYKIPKNFIVRFYCQDFISFKITKNYDLSIGNPPFSKIKFKNLIFSKKNDFENFKSSNLASYFLEKCIKNSSNTIMIMPKNILNTLEFSKTRDFIKETNISSIIDFGEKGFKGVLIETILITISSKKQNFIKVKSLPKNIVLKQKKDYIADSRFPYWIIYRNDFFDTFEKNIKFNIFDVFRDRQITNSKLSTNKSGVRVIKSRNISNDGKSIINIPKYDSYLKKNEAKKLSVYKYLNDENVYLTPNMTYNNRVIRKPKNCLVNGSVAILIPKNNIKLNDEQLEFLCSVDFRKFMDVARNYQTRTLNIDSNSVYFFGARR